MYEVCNAMGISVFDVDLYNLLPDIQVSVPLLLVADALTYRPTQIIRITQILQ